MSRIKKILAFVAIFGLYSLAGTMEYNDQVAIEQARNNAESK